MVYYKVYVDSSNQLFTYSDKNLEYEIGDKVIVPFRNQKRSGFIIEEETFSGEIEFKILNILSRAEDGIKLDSKYVELIKWMVSYYLSDYFSVITAMIPKGLKIKYNDYYKISPLKESDLENEIIKFMLERTEVSASYLSSKLKAKYFKEALENKDIIKIDTKVNLNYLKDRKEIDSKVLDFFKNKEKISKENLEAKFSKAKINKALTEGAIFLDRTLSEKGNAIDCEIAEATISYDSILNEEQEQARDKIKNGDKKYYLLKGITGSGKTEVYIDLIKDAFKEGAGSIFLVPEISLTPQMIDRFKNEFRENIAILHSKLSDSERAKEWYNIYTGNKKIVLGVRSAIFAPVKNIKYIILDEEHETTYKQDTNPRYNAKYVAIKRSLLEGSKLILGSATPSIESYYYAKQGIYEAVYINNRYSDAKLPKVEIVDMKEEKNDYFSEKLLLEIKNRLIKKEQVILLLNRKGYSTYIQCAECSHVEECDHCSIKMSYYSSQNILKCNYCGKIVKYRHTCSKCGSSKVVHSGKGIERVEEELRKYFDVNIIRVDSDKGREKSFYEKMYFDFLRGKYDIMIGTQLVSKGLHFPNVTLVGVINADIILNFPDFRASEKTFQLLTQVSGRSGRGDKEGEVIIQTYQAEHFSIKKVEENDYEGFFEYELEARELLEYPPFSKTINIGISSVNEKELEEKSNKILTAINNESVEIYGPMPSMVYKVKDRYRRNIFIKGSKRNIDLYKIDLKNKIKIFEEDKSLRISIDIDPINIF